MNLELEAYEGELTQLRRVFKMARHLSADKLEGVYFYLWRQRRKRYHGFT